jgi:hypothetical protein
MATTTDDPRPETITVEQIATDLTLSNEEGSSWFGYGYDEEAGVLLCELYSENGQIIKTFAATITFEEIN